MNPPTRMPHDCESATAIGQCTSFPQASTSKEPKKHTKAACTRYLAEQEHAVAGGTKDNERLTSPKSVQVAISPREHLFGFCEEHCLWLLAGSELLAIHMRVGHQFDPLYKVLGQHGMLSAPHHHSVAALHRLHHRYMLLSGTIGSVLLEQRHRLSAALHHHALVQYLHYASTDGTPINFSHTCFHDIAVL